MASKVKPVWMIRNIFQMLNEDKEGTTKCHIGLDNMYDIYHYHDKKQYILLDFCTPWYHDTP